VRQAKLSGFAAAGLLIEYLQSALEFDLFGLQLRTKDRGPLASVRAVPAPLFVVYSIPSSSRTFQSEAARMMSDGVQASMAPSATASKVVIGSLRACQGAR
jgi:hypothetical protein